MITKYLSCVIVLCSLSVSSSGAGLQLLQAPGLEGAIWYPCSAEPNDVPLGELAPPAVVSLRGVKDCSISAAKLPLVIFSHGRGAWFGAHQDTAESLADAGFVVAAINHPGDNVKDSSRRDTLSIWESRPADVARLLNFLLQDWKDRVIVDPERIGFFGFSLGGYTGLVLAGANPDMQRFAARCIQKIGSCAELHNGASLPILQRDTRIKAVVLADAALSTAFTQESVKGIQIPLQVWRSELGGYGVDAGGTTRVAGILPGTPEIHVVPAGHYAFLAPCSPALAEANPRICVDTPQNFDRQAFHRDFDASVIRFFREHLVSR